MAQRSHPAFLRLVHSDNEPARAVAGVGSAASSQDSFLPSGHPNTLIFLAWGKASMEDLLDIFELSKPKLIFDMRVAPRFDLGRLTRRHFFELLRKFDCQYVDLLGRMGVGNINDAVANPALLASQATQFMKNLRPPNSGPLVFMHDDDTVDDNYLTAIANSIPCGPAAHWQVFRPLAGDDKLATSGRAIQSIDLARENATPLVRSTVFISHATPQDNAFVTWLSARLVSAGYDVWCDITNLTAGDGFWRDIEEVIRVRAAKVIFVQSKYVKEKTGTRKEVYLALKVGERSRLARFVIPMRIDETPFDETLIELIDLQAIDCRHDWLVGLKSLLAVLQRDKVPRSASFKADQFTDLVSRASAPVGLTKADEVLSSNLLAISDLPKQIHFYSIAGVQTNQLPAMASRLSIPAFAHYAHMATTATHEQFEKELDSIGLGHVKVGDRAAISWEDYLAGQSGDLPEWKRGDARNKAFAMLNKAWEGYMTTRTASVGTMANGRTFWYFPHNRFPDNKFRFSDFSGRLIRRQLVGFSAKRRVYWHFGIQSRCVLLERSFFFAVTPHVTFSVDGAAPLPSKSQLHSLRRSFCRSWWNDRWRDLLQGFISAISDDQKSLKLNVGCDFPVTVDARFQPFTSPVSLFVEDEARSKSTDVEDEVADQWDDDLDDPDSLGLFEEVNLEDTTPADLKG